MFWKASVHTFTAWFCTVFWVFLFLLRVQRQSEEELENKPAYINEDQEGGKEKQLFLNTGFAVPVQSTTCGNNRAQLDNSRRREFDEESLESFSSLPDPVDPTTVTKTFKPRKASAQASLASKDKTPKSKNKRRSASQFKNRSRTNGMLTRDMADLEMFYLFIYLQVVVF